MDTALDLIHMIKLNLFHNYSISFFLPIGLQTTQIHLNEMSKKDFNNLKTFINKKIKI